MSEKLEIRNKADIDRSLPLISIIGRPNVGKSTLFNRLIGERRAITDPTPGVTRDPIPARYLLGNHPVTLVDSGGVKLEKEGLDYAVSEKSLSLMEISDLILFVLECTDLTGEDMMLIEELRPYSDKVILVVNKVDDVSRLDLVWNFFSYGYQRVVGISAAHGTGFEELEDTMLGMLNLERIEEEPEEIERIKLAILGKPNTGKSTLTNLLTGRDISIVSEIAGTTRDVMRGTFEYKGTDYTVLDTAGIRRKSKVEEDVEYYSVNRAIASIDGCDIVFLMIDAEKGLADQDKKIAAQAVNRGKGIILVLNKWDLVPPHRDAQRAAADRIRFLFPVLSFAPIVFISAKDNQGIPALLKTALKMEAQFHNKISTNKLNTALAEWIYENPIPSKGKIKYKVKYLTQLSAAPVKFAVFVNRKKGFPDSWMQYMVNRIRSVFGFKDVPIRLEIKENRNLK